MYSYEEYTRKEVKIASKLDFAPVKINGVSYTLPKLVMKFRRAFKNPKIREKFIPWGSQPETNNPASGFCGIISFSLRKIFRGLRVKFSSGFSHYWNEADNVRLDFTGDQFSVFYSTQSKSYEDFLFDEVYAYEYKKESLDFKKSMAKLARKDSQKLDELSDMFLQTLFGRDYKIE